MYLSQNNMEMELFADCNHIDIRRKTAGKCLVPFCSTINYCLEHSIMARYVCMMAETSVLIQVKKLSSLPI